LHPGQRSAPCFVQDISQPVLSQTLREGAGNWAASLTPSRSDLLLDLAAIWQAVLRVPDRTARPFSAKDVSGGVASAAASLQNLR
jgi:hypothetical protein